MVKKTTAYKKKYKVSDGTYYSPKTSDKMIDILERLRANRKRVTFRFGDPKTGRDWGEDSMISGRIGRSTGEVKIPLLVHNRRSMGGLGLLDDSIVKIIESKGKKTLYKNPKYYMNKALKKEIKDSKYLNKKFKRLGII